MTDEHKYCLLLGGIGSGKTFAGAVYALHSAINYPNGLGGIFANTHKQLINSTLHTLFKVLGDCGIEYRWNQMKGKLYIGDTEILCSSLENPDPLRGLELAWAWIDEASYIKKRETFDMLMGRMRDKNGPLQIRLTTTPKGFNWLYDYFAGDLKTDEFNYISARSDKNKHLPEGYLNTLYANLDSKMIEQEIEGKFVNISQGRIYYQFDRTQNTRELRRFSQHPVMIGMDFNVNPMTAIAAHVVNDSVLVLDEFWLTSSNTAEMGEHLGSRFGYDLTVIPDATGKALKTSAAGRSDHDILKEMGFNIPDVRNPFRRDRYNLINKMLEDGKLIISPKCTKLIRDLEQLSYKEGTDLPDLSDKTLGHISDALGYLCWYVNPYITKRPSLRAQKLF